MDEDGAAISVQYGYHNIHNNLIKNNLVGIFLSTGCNVNRNTFISNTAHAGFIHDLDESFKNRWFKNYWDRPRFAPKPIFGVINLPILFLPCFEFDLFPSIIPTKIIT